MERGDIDGFIAPRVPSLAGKKNPNIGWLFSDPIAAGRDYFTRTGIFPIMHITGIRRELVEKHPWLPAAVLQGVCGKPKAKCLEALEDTAASKVTLPFVEEQLRAAREFMGDDFWSYGLAPNRKVLETFLRHHHAQGLSSRLVSPEELFHPSTHESFRDLERRCRRASARRSLLSLLGSAQHGRGRDRRIAGLDPHIDHRHLACSTAAIAFSKVGTRSPVLVTGSKPTAPCARPSPAQSMSGSEMRWPIQRFSGGRLRMRATRS